MIPCNVCLPQLCLCILLISLHEVTLLHNIISATGIIWGCLKVTVGITAVSDSCRGHQGHSRDTQPWHCPGKGASMGKTEQQQC